MIIQQESLYSFHILIELKVRKTAEAMLASTYLVVVMLSHISIDFALFKLDIRQINMK